MSKLKSSRCYKCNGKGVLLNKDKQPRFLHIVESRCFRCAGTGRITKPMVTKIPCPKCLGVGEYYGESCNLCASFSRVGLVPCEKLVNLEILKSFYGNSWSIIKERFKEQIDKMEVKENGEAATVN